VNRPVADLPPAEDTNLLHLEAERGGKGNGRRNPASAGERRLKTLSDTIAHSAGRAYLP